MARTFNGTSDHISVASIFGLTTFPVTMAAWFNPSSLAADATILSIGDTGTDNDFFQLLVRTTGAIRFRASTGGSTTATTTAGTTTTGVWAHACGKTTTNSSRIAYLNGVASTADTNTRLWPSTLDTSSIGRRGTATSVEWFPGPIAEVGFWDVGLTDAEVAILALGVSPLHVRPASLIAYCPLIDPATDYVNATAWTMTGTSASAHPRIYTPSAPWAVPLPGSSPPPSLYSEGSFLPFFI